ncbi:MAG: serine/threonine-protein kinase [Pyrinomonadaceae bacterium]
MTRDKVLTVAESRNTNISGKVDDLVGHILFERFLIEVNLSDSSLGGDCVTYLAKDIKHFCRMVVLRVFSNPSTNASGRPGRVQDVYDVLMRLRHPNIEWILETGKLFDGRPYIVTTSTSGQTLEQILSGERRLVLDRVARIVESVAEALGAAHAKGILHGGVTPSNIVITPQEFEGEIVRLTSFGTDPCRSLSYRAPELMFDDGRPTPASDVYSLAAVAYKMLTGDVPFKASGREEMLELIVRGIQTRPSVLRTDLSAAAEAILLSALQYKAVRRPRDARAFGRDFADELRNSALRHVAAVKKTAEAPAVVFIDPVEVAVPATVPNERVFETRSSFSRKPAAAVSDRAITWSLIVLLLAGAVSIPIGQTILDEGHDQSAISSIVRKPADTRLPREIKYSIDGMGIKTPGSTASQSILQNSFTNSGEYRMTFEADSAGNAYVFSEAADEQGRTIYNLLYPLSKMNKGSAAIEPKQQVRTRASTINEAQGNEVIWLVWTAGKQDDLDAARQSAFASDGVVRGENDVQKVKHFLERNKNNKLDVRRDDADRQTVVNGSGDRIVYRIELGPG